MRTVAAGVVLLLVAISGCSSDEAAPAEVAPLASESGAGSVASPSPAATSGVEAIPSPPAEAAAGTPQGASAFAEYFFNVVVNDAYHARDPSKVTAFSDAACGSCQNIVADIQALREAGLRVSGKRFKVQFAAAAAPDTDGGGVVVDFRFSSDEYVATNSSGESVRSEPAQIDQDAQVKLLRRSSSWVVVAIRTVGA